MPDSPQTAPKAAGIADDLRSRIASGAYPAGDRLPTRTELRAIYQVSNATLQRALDWLLAEGFVEADGRRGTFVRRDSPHLTRYALLFPNQFGPNGPTNSFFRILIDQAAVAGESRKVIVHDGFAGRAGFLGYESLLADMRANRLAGLIFATAPYMLRGTPLVADDGLPRVAFMSRSTEEHIPAIYPPDGGFAERIATFLRQRGCRRVAWLVNSELQAEPVANMLRTLAANGLELPPEWLHGLALGQPRWTRNLIRLMLGQPGAPRPDAVVVADDNLLTAVGEELAALGIRPPDDLLLVGHANFPEPTPCPVPAIRFGIAIPQLLDKALTTIDALRRGEAVPERQEVPILSTEEAAAVTNLA